MAERAGILIAFEGIDGAGKTTQAEMLRARLSAAGLDVVASKEPTDGPWGRRLRASATEGRLSVEEEIELFLKDRAEHVRQVIQPALDDGRVVILDRYFYSTVAYQGARGVSVEELDRRNRELAPVPDLVLLLDVDPDHSTQRISEGRRETPNLFEQVEYLRRVRQIFILLAERHGEISRLDGSRPIAELHDRILRQVVDGPVRQRLEAAARDDASASSSPPESPPPESPPSESPPSESPSSGPSRLRCSAELRGDGDWNVIRERLLDQA